MANLAGTWKQEKTENMDDFLKAMGVGMVKRKLASTMNPTVVITEDANKLTVKTSSTLSSSLAVIDLGGKEFESDTQGLGDGLYTASVGLKNFSSVGFMKRKVAVTMNPLVQITINGEDWVIKTSTTVTSSEAKFRVNGEEYESDTQGMGDGTYQCTASMEGGKLVVTAVPKTTTLKGSVQTRELVNENELLQTMECEGVVCKRYFKKQ